MTQNTNQQPPGYYPRPTFYEEDSIDIKRYISLFLSNWYWFAIALFISISITYGINRWSEKVYIVSSTLLIKDDQFGGGISAMENFIPGGDIFRNHQNLQNELGILKSYSLNYKVMCKLPEFWVSYTSVGRRRIAESRMYKSSPFTVVFDTLADQLKNVAVSIELLPGSKYRMQIGENIDTVMKFGGTYRSSLFKFSIEGSNNYKFIDDASNRYYFLFESIEGLANRYRSRLSVAPIQEEASLVNISISGNSARQQADYLNMLMEVYIDDGLELKNKTADKSIEFINDQLGLITDSLTTAEDRLEQFRSRHSLINLSSEGVLIQSRLERFETEKYDLELQQKYYQYLKEYLDNRENTGDIISPSILGVTDPNLSRLVVELATFQKQKTQLAFNLSGDQPAFSHIDANIENTRESLMEIIKSGINNISRLIENTEEKINEIEIQINGLPETERNLIRIQREFDLNNSVYTYLLEKRAEAGIARASNVSDNRIIDEALTFNSSRIKPKIRQNYLMAIILGLAIPLFLIILIDFLNNKILDRKDIEKVTDVPIIGFIGHSSTKSELPIIDTPGSALAESFRSIRTSLKYFGPSEESKVIVITSTISGEGKTFVSLNLASIISLLGKKVLLVGLDMRKPRLHKVLNVDNSVGLSSYLIGEIDFGAAVVSTKIDNLYFTPSGQAPPNPAELIESEYMIKFLDNARKDFDYIILDTPPVAIVTDTLLLASQTDINFFVIRQRFSSKNTLSLINELASRGELKNLSILINDINLSGYYGYGLRYGNSIGYGGYHYGYNLYGGYGYRGYGNNNRNGDYYTGRSV